MSIEATISEFYAVLSTVRTHPYNSRKDVEENCWYASKLYFSVAAKKDAKATTASDKQVIYSSLFKMRTQLEKKFEGIVRENPEIFWDLIYERGFFGGSLKQGLSVRFPLTSCQSTKNCGAFCYAHDGRDKHYHAVLRGVLNQQCANNIDLLMDNKTRESKAFKKQIERAIKISKKEAALTIEEKNYTRSPRLRFSHVGEMTKSFNFTNWLASEVKRLSKDSVNCVIYTRHENVRYLDNSSIIVNFTVEDEAPLPDLPLGTRIVASAWGGETIKSAEINFIEHHPILGHMIIPTSEARNICPVTLHSSEARTCDEAFCEKCFV